MTSANGLLPLFTSAPRITMYIDSTPVAFAIGLNLNVSVDVRLVQVMGHYEAISAEPLLVGVVTGTMQIFKLISAF